MAVKSNDNAEFQTGPGLSVSKKTLTSRGRIYSMKNPISSGQKPSSFHSVKVDCFLIRDTQLYGSAETEVAVGNQGNRHKECTLRGTILFAHTEGRACFFELIHKDELMPVRDAQMMVTHK